MPFRTVIVSSHSKLEYSLNYLVYKTVDDIKRIQLDEIHTLIIESTQVSITSALLSELMNKKIKVIFCDEKRNPVSELIPYYGDSISTRRINEQINWKQEIKDAIWQAIIKEKILNQATVLSKVDEKESQKLLEYAAQVEIGDITNREGHAAKVYFNRIYGDGFTRNNSDEKNIFLNYGYTILLSQFNRVITSKGYLTQLGIHHKSELNAFNFSCDLMEPFRPLIDNLVFELTQDNYKDKLVNILNEIVIIDKQRQTLVIAISIYCSSVFKALSTSNVGEIKFYERSKD